jgi:hypothetical protein
METIPVDSAKHIIAWFETHKIEFTEWSDVKTVAKWTCHRLWWQKTLRAGSTN